MKGSGRLLEKAAQKLLGLWAGGGETSTASLAKFFCYFLFTKSSLSFRRRPALKEVAAFWKKRRKNFLDFGPVAVKPARPV
jgi:hypothetical protein